MDIDPGTATAAELVAALRAHEVSSRELLDDLLARVGERNPALNAVVALDVERAREAAAAADEATAAGAATGALHGLPMTIKDVWETAGLATTSGAPELADHVPTTDALAVARLKAAGAIVFGKTNVPLYAGDVQTYNDVFGRTNNPWDVTRTTGGSSGGAAAAVAAGLTPLELGSDIGGSIRNPAHYNGVYGLKPTWGIVPSRGHIPGPPGSLVEPDVNCGGPLARGVGDLALALDVVAGPLPEDAVAWRLELPEGPPVSSVRGLRVATVVAEGSDVLPVAAEVRGCLGAFTDRLADAGAQVEAVPLPVSLADGLRSWQDLVLPIIGAGLPADVFEAFAPMGDLPAPDPVSNAARALVSRARDLQVADAVRQQHRRAWAGLFERFDVVLAPVMATAAHPHDTDRPITDRVLDVDGVEVPGMLAMAWCGAIGTVLLPVVTLPTGLTPSGLPVGVQVVGPHLSDRRLLRIAALLDEVGGAGFVPPPASFVSPVR
ncbi:MAG: amidase family protein [Acidimicrobiales bacterium]